MPKTQVKKDLFYDFVKRIIDILGSIVLIIIFFPIGLLVAMLIKFDTPGPVFADIPERVGRNGKPFKMYKFRSMIQNAHQLIRENPEFAELYAQYKQGSYKLKEDPRITTIGKFIRKHSLDEIPQFLNVLKGDMSLVGPRAYHLDELDEQQKQYPHTKDAVKVVLSVKPGITGYWQVSGRSEVNFDKRIQMDADYVKKRSILYDMFLILKSPWAMITGRGAL